MIDSRHWNFSICSKDIGVKAMVTGRDRRPQLGIKMALECRGNIIYPMKNKNSKFNNQPVNPDGTLVNKEGTV